VPAAGNRSRTGRPKAADSRLGREGIVRTTLALIDSDGLENFSVRNVAKALDVFPTAVYWHVGDRNALLSDVVTLVLADLTPKRSAGKWQDWLRQLLVRYRNIIRQHPNVAPLIGVQLVSNGSLDFRLVEGILECLTEAGFKGQRLVNAYNVVMGGMVGFTTQEFASVPPDETEEWKNTMRRSIAAVDKKAYPRIAEHLSMMTNKTFMLRWENGVTAPLDAGFEMFVETLVRGVEGLASKPKRAPASRVARK
jgi:TetR/AcrR family tetracycline transcriptional repressor